MPDGDFTATFNELRALMLRDAVGMTVAMDAPGELVMHAPWPHPRKPKEAMWFGMVRQGKAYVSYHLMPLYMNPAMQAKVSPALARRMQGRTCFNFKTTGPELVTDLAALTREAAAFYATPLKL
jgi:hypothetical protein